MFNFKISGIAAGAAFVLSLVIGLFSGSGFLIPLLRALIFAIIFFALSCLVFWLLAQFIPDLLSSPEDDLGFPVSGSRVDISVDGPVSGAFPTDNSESVDDIAGRPATLQKTASLPLDQEGNTVYDGEVVGDLEAVGDGESEIGSGSGMFGRAGSTETIPELGGESENIPGSAADVENTGDIGFDSSGPRRPRSSSKKPDMAGDFNPKELAQAIQTVLKRDEKG
ncbi:MAG: hypothetical protein FWG07_10940 [Treponema sp.]|nr:hypothetical protein [Treponema sp.]